MLSPPKEHRPHKSAIGGAGQSPVTADAPPPISSRAQTSASSLWLACAHAGNSVVSAPSSTAMAAENSIMAPHIPSMAWQDDKMAWGSPSRRGKDARAGLIAAGFASSRHRPPTSSADSQ